MSPHPLSQHPLSLGASVAESMSPLQLPARRRLRLLLAHGLVAVVGLAIGAVGGIMAAFWLGFIEISC